MPTKPKTLAIAKPTTVNLPAIVPPPRKEDVINAMVERARVKHAEEAQKMAERKQAAYKTFHDAVNLHFDHHRDAFARRVLNYGATVEIEFRMNVMPPHLQKLKSEYDRLPTMGNFDAAQVKREIRDRMSNSGDRVKALLGNADAVKKLDAALAEIGI